MSCLGESLIESKSFDRWLRRHRWCALSVMVRRGRFTEGRLIKTVGTSSQYVYVVDGLGPVCIFDL